MKIENFKDLKINDYVTVYGWAHSIRRHRNMIFIDLRNRSGKVQCVVKGKEMKKLDGVLEESVLKIEGSVRERINKNPNIKFGNIEIYVEKLNVLSKSKSLPLDIKNPEIIKNTKEETRLKWRYLDLRRPEIMNGILFRAQTAQIFREFLNSHGFVEIETPYFAKSTPEGSRDFIVPSRIHKGKFYALAQSPQLYKQILMVSGFEKYYQFARCFRDEDPRADRQPEFTQIDIEMSFIERDDVLKIIEELVKYVVKKMKNIDLPDFQRITYKDAMNVYGSDKPDLRIKEKIQTQDNIKFISTNLDIKDEELNVLKKFNGIKYYYNGKGNYDKDIDKIKAKGNFIAYINFNEKTWKSACTIMGNVRNMIGEWKNEKTDEYKFLWVIDFPLFELNEENELTSFHHPFTMVKNPNMLKEPLKALSQAYDLVLNGSEIAGGSIRIHDELIQKDIFKILKLSDKEIEKRYGFLLKAFEYGVPPHGGIAFGFDRFVAELLFKKNIREVIAFPKTSDWRELMTDIPSDIPQKYVNETIKPMVDNLKKRKIL